MPLQTPRKRSHDIELNGYPYAVVRDKGVPAWVVTRSPEIAGQTGGPQDVERAYRSCHSGFGWSQYVAPNTYHYCTSGAGGIGVWGGLDERFPNQGIMGPLVVTLITPAMNATVGVTDIFEFGNYLYCLSGRFIGQIDTTASPEGVWAKFTLGDSATLLTEAELFDDYVVIANSTGDDLYTFDGSTFTARTAAPKGSYLAKWEADPDFSLATSYSALSTTCLAWLAQNSNPATAANWAGFSTNNYPVGDASGSITGLVAVDRTIFIARTDGLYYLDGATGRAPRLIEAIPINANNGVNTIADSLGRIWYPAKSGLYRYDPNSGIIDEVTPGRGQPDRSGIRGLVSALAHFRSWTYASVYDGTDSYIMVGRERENGEPGFGPMIWHGAIAKISGTKVTSMHLSSLTDPPRLWMGLLSGNVAYFRLPSNGDNPLLDSNYRYTDTGSIYYPSDDYGGGGMLWQQQNVVVEAENMSTGSRVDVYIRRDLGSWVRLGNINDNGRLVILTSGDQRFSQAELRIDVVNASSLSTPVIRVLAGRATQRPSQDDIISTRFVCYDEALSRLGLPSRYTGQTLADQLDALDDYYPVILKDWWTGAERESTVIVMPGHKSIIVQEGDKSGGLAVDVTMRRLSVRDKYLLTESGQHLTDEAGVNLETE